MTMTQVGGGKISPKFNQNIFKSCSWNAFLLCYGQHIVYKNVLTQQQRTWQCSSCVGGGGGALKWAIKWLALVSPTTHVQQNSTFIARASLPLLNTIAHYTTLFMCPKPRTFKAKKICASDMRVVVNIRKRKLQRRECDTSDLEKTHVRTKQWQVARIPERRGTFELNLAWRRQRRKAQTHKKLWRFLLRWRQYEVSSSLPPLLHALVTAKKIPHNIFFISMEKCNLFGFPVYSCI